MTNVNEIFVPINGSEGYEISNHGSVKRLGSNRGRGYPVNDRIIKGTPLLGYPRVTIPIRGITKELKIHRLVAEHFIPNPENKETVNHKDGVKTNNFVDNLEWCTFSENNIHAYKTGLKNSKGRCNGRSKITESDVIEIRMSSLTGVELSKIYGIHKQMISGIKTRKYWKHVA